MIDKLALDHWLRKNEETNKQENLHHLILWTRSHHHYHHLALDDGCSDGCIISTMSMDDEIGKKDTETCIVPVRRVL